MSISKNKKPTDSEMEILNILWDKGEASVREVHEALKAHKDAGYTTTLKLMQIMLEKNMLSRNDHQKVHIYSPIISKESVRASSIKNLITSLFSGSPSKLVLHALGKHPPTIKELEAIEAYISTLKKSTDNK